MEWADGFTEKPKLAFVVHEEKRRQSGCISQKAPWRTRLEYNNSKIIWSQLYFSTTYENLFIFHLYLTVDLFGPTGIVHPMQINEAEDQGVSGKVTWLEGNQMQALNLKIKNLILLSGPKAIL